MSQKAATPSVAPLARERSPNTGRHSKGCDGIASVWRRQGRARPQAVRQPAGVEQGNATPTPAQPHIRRHATAYTRRATSQHLRRCWLFLVGLPLLPSELPALPMPAAGGAPRPGVMGCKRCLLSATYAGREGSDVQVRPPTALAVGGCTWLSCVHDLHDTNAERARS